MKKLHMSKRMNINKMSLARTEFLSDLAMEIQDNTTISGISLASCNDNNGQT